MSFSPSIRVHYLTYSTCLLFLTDWGKNATIFIGSLDLTLTPGHHHSYLKGELHGWLVCSFGGFPLQVRGLVKRVWDCDRCAMVHCFESVSHLLSVCEGVCCQALYGCWSFWLISGGRKGNTSKLRAAASALQMQSKKARPSFLLLYSGSLLQWKLKQKCRKL